MLDPPRPEVREAIVRCHSAGMRIIVITGDHPLTAAAIAREAATIVLTDDNFASIVAAVEEGRVVYDNVRKFIVYIFAHATPEVGPFLVFALAGGAVPLRLTVLQKLLGVFLGASESVG